MDRQTHLDVVCICQPAYIGAPSPPPLPQPALIFILGTFYKYSVGKELHTWSAIARSSSVGSVSFRAQFLLPLHTTGIHTLHLALLEPSTTARWTLQNKQVTAFTEAVSAQYHSNLQSYYFVVSVDVKRLVHSYQSHSGFMALINWTMTLHSVFSVTSGKQKYIFTQTYRAFMKT